MDKKTFNLFITLTKVLLIFKNKVMKIKFLLLAVVVVFFSTITNAQKTSFDKGDKVLSLGIGLGNVLYSGTGYTSKIPPISASFEYGIADKLFDDKSSIGIGGYLAYSSAKWEYNYGGDVWGWKYSNTIIGARGSLHYAFVDKLDTYTGLLLGYDIVSAKEYGNWYGTQYSANSSSAIWSWYLGGRYYFNDRFAAMAELGYGISIINIGASLKL